MEYGSLYTLFRFLSQLINRTERKYVHWVETGINMSAVIPYPPIYTGHTLITYRKTVVPSHPAPNYGSSRSGKTYIYRTRFRMRAECLQ